MRRFLPLLPLSFVLACSSPSGSSDPAPAPEVTTDPGAATEPSGNVSTPPPADPVDDPGPAPAGCDLAKDGDGFFTRENGKAKYVGFVPNGYAGQPMRLLVGLHGCGDEAYNFATWAVNPWDGRGNQDWIGIAVDGATGGGNCWKQADEDAVLAAIDDVAKCLYVHKQKVVLAGFSSGGELAYGMAMKHADRFAGLLAENTTLSAAGSSSALLAGAARKIPVAHLAHTDDSVFPIKKVHADWDALRAAGFPLDTHEVPGDHNGTSDDWTGWLLPRMAAWRTP